MAGKGGYQKPSKPAVSAYGPGGKTQRTDGGPASKQAARYMAGGEYGEGQEMMNIQNSAPMSASPAMSSASPVSNGAQAGPQIQPIGLNQPTTMPGVPVTDGAALGDGRGTDALGLQQPQDPRQQEVNQLIARYLPDLQDATGIPGVPNSYVSFVNYLVRQISQ